MVNELVRQGRSETLETGRSWADPIPFTDPQPGRPAGFEIFPCWPTHAGVVEELAGGWRSWQAAVLGDSLAKKNGSAELTAWHDRWLWPMLEGLRVSRYRINNCKGKHTDEVIAYAPTDRSLIPTSDGAESHSR